MLSIHQATISEVPTNDSFSDKSLDKSNTTIITGMLLIASCAGTYYHVDQLSYEKTLAEDIEIDGQKYLFKTIITANKLKESILFEINEKTSKLIFSREIFLDESFLLKLLLISEVEDEVLKNYIVNTLNKEIKQAFFEEISMNAQDKNQGNMSMKIFEILNTSSIIKELYKSSQQSDKDQITETLFTICYKEIQKTIQLFNGFNNVKQNEKNDLETLMIGLRITINKFKSDINNEADINVYKKLGDKIIRVLEEIQKNHQNKCGEYTNGTKTCVNINKLIDQLIEISQLNKHINTSFYEDDNKSTLTESIYLNEIDDLFEIQTTFNTEVEKSKVYESFASKSNDENNDDLGMYIENDSYILSEYSDYMNNMESKKNRDQFEEDMTNEFENINMSSICDNDEDIIIGDNYFDIGNKEMIINNDDLDGFIIGDNDEDIIIGGNYFDIGNKEMIINNDDLDGFIIGDNEKDIPIKYKSRRSRK